MILTKNNFYKKLMVGVFVIIFGLMCQAVGVDTAVLNFQKVDPNKVPDELEMLSSAIKTNFDKIETWQGKISFEKMLIYRGAEASKKLKEFAGVASAKEPNEVGQLAVGTTEFNVDLEKNFLFRHVYRPYPLEYVDFDKDITYPSSATQFERTIINTPEYEIKCYPNVRKKDGTILNRKCRKYKGKEFQWFFSEEDPRFFFHMVVPPWVQFSAILTLYRQGAIDSAHNVTLEKAQYSESIVYRVKVAMPGSNQAIGTFTYILDGTKGFNVIYIQEKNNGLTRAEITRDFVKIDDIFLPCKQNALHYDNDGRLQREDNLTLSDMQINMTLPGNTFSINNLGLQDGDEFVDEINNKKYLYKEGGKLVEVANKEE